MTNSLRILHLEDVGIDAELTKRVIDKSKIDAEIRVVDNKEAYVDALITFAPNVILSDHTLPSFSSKEALNIFLQSGIKIPFILVTATISEEYAVSVIKAGADDYILKDHLERLPEAILNALDKIEKQINLEKQKELTLHEKTNAVLIAHETERSQMGNELLENINQILAASNLYIDCAISEEDKRLVFMQNSKKYILMAINEIKKISQVIMPPTLDERGLIESIDNWIEFKQKGNEINIRTNWGEFDNHRVSEKLQLTIYRIIQEQLNNTLKYSNAQNADLSLVQTKDSLELVVKDDGVGFDTSKIKNGVGLKNIHTRVEIHSGKIFLETSPGNGCMLKVTFPL
jgi:signal transduction histidine kinase